VAVRGGGHAVAGHAVCDDGSDPELIWGLRGGGGNLGIVTAFEYPLHPVGPMVLGGPIFWPLAYGDRLKRLTALKDVHDPHNVFRMNADIPPSGT
jgi:FAD/FMN-containing dehydrogenase